MKVNLSIIIPFYNDQDYISDCLDSIIKQKKDFNIEVILINDFSSDSTVQLCMDYVKNYPFIKLIKNELKGVSSARNCGIRFSQSDYIMFVDSDDKLCDDSLETIFNNIKLGYDFYLGTYYSHFLRDNSFQFHDTKIFEGDINHFIDAIDFYVDSSILKGPCWKVFKSSIIKENHILFPTNIDYGEDVYFVYSYLDFAKTVKVINKPLYIYTIKEKSLSHGFRNDKLVINLDLSKKLYNLKLSFSIDDIDGYMKNNRHSMIDFFNDVVKFNNKKEAKRIIKSSLDNQILNDSLNYKYNNEKTLHRIVFYLSKKKKYNLLYLLFKVNNRG